MTGPTAIRELQVFCDLPAEAAIRESAEFFAERGLLITRKDANSLALQGRSAQQARASRSRRRRGSTSSESSRATQSLGWRPAIWEPLMKRDESAGPRDVGAVAAVTAQVDPSKCRVWLTVEGQGAVAAAAEELVDRWRPRSEAAAAVVTNKEQQVFTDDG